MGKTVVKVPERTTGFCKLKDATEYATALESEIVDSVLHPKKDKSSKVKFDDCVKIYLSTRRPSQREFSKIKALIPYFEGVSVSDTKLAWVKFCDGHKSNSVSTLNRYLAMLKSILNSSKEELDIDIPIIKGGKVKNAVVFHIKKDVREKLLSCYSDRIRSLFVVMSNQGFRSQEVAQLTWDDVDLVNKTITIRTSKNGETRVVPMHKKTYDVLSSLPVVSGNIWRDTRGNPFRDTRKDVLGDNPLASYHRRALERLKKNYGISLKMRVHDWRHDWASRMVEAGVDLITIQKLGGWKSLEMVKRYATFSAKHEQDSINKI